jgi:hypothetical protein
MSSWLHPMLSEPRGPTTESGVVGLQDVYWRDITAL